jgi:hypothetical protein
MITGLRESLNLKTVVLLAGCAALTACNSTSGNNAATALSSAAGNQENASVAAPDRSQDLRAFCPKTFIRDGTEVYRTFEKGVKKEDPDALKSLRFQSTITEVVRECNYNPQTLAMRVGIKGRVINGPSGASGTLDVPVRVAIANPSTKEVVYSQLHQVPVTLQPGQSNARFSFIDSQIDIPIPEKENIVVYVGFDEGPPA